MTKIKITKLVWDKWNIEYIKKHNVSQAEIEEAIIQVLAHRRGYSRRVILIGRSGNRILSIIIKKDQVNIML